MQPSLLQSTQRSARDTQRPRTCEKNQYHGLMGYAKLWIATFHITNWGKTGVLGRSLYTKKHQSTKILKRWYLGGWKRGSIVPLVMLLVTHSKLEVPRNNPFKIPQQWGMDYYFLSSLGKQYSELVEKEYKKWEKYKIALGEGRKWLGWSCLIQR